MGLKVLFIPDAVAADAATILQSAGISVARREPECAPGCFSLRSFHLDCRQGRASVALRFGRFDLGPDPGWAVTFHTPPTVRGHRQAIRLSEKIETILRERGAV